MTDVTQQILQRNKIVYQCNLNTVKHHNQVNDYRNQSHHLKEICNFFLPQHSSWFEHKVLDLTNTESFTSVYLLWK